MSSTSLEISKKTVDALTKEGYYRDSELKGFGVRVTRTGKMYFAEAKLHGTRKTIRVSLGKHGVITPAEARSLAKEILGKLARGDNPNAERLMTRAKQESAKLEKEITLARVLEDYFQRGNLKDSTIHDYKKTLNRCVPDWMDAPLNSITDEMVERRHKELSNLERRPGDGKPANWDGKAQSNKAMRILVGLWNYSMEKYASPETGKPMIQHNPVRRISNLKLWNKTSRRQSVILKHQLRPWHNAVMELGNETIRDWLRLLLFTGLRKEEAAQLTWSSIDFQNRTIKLEKEETKNSMPHMIPMSEYVYKLLLSRWQDRKSQLVFPSKRSADKTIVEPRKQMAHVTSISGVTFSVHDLRRTFATVAESLDIPPYALRKLLNHKTNSDVTGGYIVADAERLREPMKRIHDFICEKIGYSLDGSPVTETNRVPPITKRGSKKTSAT